MAQTAALVAEIKPPIGLYRTCDRNDEAVTAAFYSKDPRAKLEQISAFWRNKARFAEARRRLDATVALESGWDTYGAEVPNEQARAWAGTVLDALETELLLPAQLMASAEGGVAISFVEGDNRAEIEIYNTGEVAVATYSSSGEPRAWELTDLENALKNAISEIRVHLAA